MLDIDHQAPDQVFHVTSSEVLDSIQRSGLHPDPERGRNEDWRQTEELLDEIRPDRVVAMNISRKNGIFANPYAEGVSKYSMGMHKVADDAQPVVLGVDTDPAQVLVADAYLLSEVRMHVHHSLFRGQDIRTESAKKLAKAYWDESLPLADFRRYYVPEHTPLGSTYVRRDDAPADLPYEMKKPEVIIPGPVDPKHVKLATAVLSMGKF